MLREGTSKWNIILICEWAGECAAGSSERFTVCVDDIAAEVLNFLSSTLGWC